MIEGNVDHVDARKDFRKYLEDTCTCAGVILIHQKNGELTCLLVETEGPPYCPYSFPKGRRNHKEKLRDAAARELYEETGLGKEDVCLSEYPFYVEYRRDTGLPHILYFTGTLIKDTPLKPVDTKEVKKAFYHPVNIQLKGLLSLQRWNLMQQAVNDSCTFCCTY